MLLLHCNLGGFEALSGQGGFRLAQDAGPTSLSARLGSDDRAVLPP